MTFQRQTDKNPFRLDSPHAPRRPGFRMHAKNAAWTSQPIRSGLGLREHYHARRTVTKAQAELYRGSAAVGTRDSQCMQALPHEDPRERS